MDTLRYRKFIISYIKLENFLFVKLYKFYIQEKDFALFQIYSFILCDINWLQ